MTKYTRPEWEIAREEREALRNDAVGNLLPSQRTALLYAMKAIMSSDSELHDMLAIDKAEYKLRSEFPQLTEEAVSDMTCTCED